MSPPKLVVLSVASIFAGGLTVGWAVIMAGATTAAGILWWVTRNGLLLFYGRSSYSLYLLHVPVGMRVVNLSQHWQLGLSSMLGVIALAFAFSTVPSYELWRWVERPAQKWAAAVRYRRPVAVALA